MIVNAKVFKLEKKIQSKKFLNKKNIGQTPLKFGSGTLLDSKGIAIRLIMDMHLSNLSRLMGKPTICIGENKGADQLRSNCEADQRLCFRYTDSTIPLLSKSKISSL